MRLGAILGNYTVVAGGCWRWAGGSSHPFGYGTVWFQGRTALAHRLFYRHHVGPIPDGLQIDHLCRNPLCVNPAHLEVVAPRENTLRGTGPTAVNARKAECLNGHPFAGENLILDPDGERRCRQCERERHRRQQWELASVDAEHHAALMELPQPFTSAEARRRLGLHDGSVRRILRRLERCGLLDVEHGYRKVYRAALRDGE